MIKQPSCFKKDIPLAYKRKGRRCKIDFLLSDILAFEIWTLDWILEIAEVAYFICLRPHPKKSLKNPS